MKLEILESLYAVCKIPSAHQIPEWALAEPDSDTAGRHIVSYSVTDKECSLVLPASRVPANLDGVECKSDWRAFRIAGTLDFDLVGVIAEISSALQKAAVPLFVLSLIHI